MLLTSSYFLIFLIALIPIYYLFPKKVQWVILLAASMVFYLFSGWTNIFYMIGVSLIAFISTQFIQRNIEAEKKYLKENKDILSKEQKKSHKALSKKKRKRMMLCGVLPIVFLLIIMKCLRPVNNLLLSNDYDIIQLMVPLGLSYYSLQTIGYIIDVYWNKIHAEKNYFKLVLFVSFFPQITQGPISDFKDLSTQLTAEHPFRYDRFAGGFQRLLWGYFKKLVVANLMAPYVSDLFENYSHYTGITLFVGLFVVMIQLYADFSGYMDIVCGCCEILDIKLSENFDRPFFSHSLAEFWRRWHITLGIWFKKYVFFPVGMSRISKVISKEFDENLNDKLISTLALLSIWFLIGVWHGVTLPFILWGMATGVIMIISVWLEDFYAKCREKLHIKDKSRWFGMLQIARTFTLVSLLEVFSDAGSLRDGCGYILSIFFSASKIPTDFSTFMPFVDNTMRLIFVVVGLLMMLVFSIVGRKQSIRIYFNKLPLVIRAIALAGLFCIIVSVGIVALIEEDGGFLYANF